MSENGLGAWYLHGSPAHKYYVRGDGRTVDYPTDTPDSAALFVWATIKGLKAALIKQGYVGDMNPDTGYFGSGMERVVKRFRNEVGFVSSLPKGTIGVNYSKALLVPLVAATEASKRIPNKLLQKLIQGESLWDPGAQGFSTPPDLGLNQINRDFHDVTVEQCCDPTFSIPWGGTKFVADKKATGNSWDGALAAYNMGLTRAKLWVEAGKPASGLVTESGFDYAAQATKYVAYIRGQVI